MSFAFHTPSSLMCFNLPTDTPLKCKPDTLRLFLHPHVHTQRVHSDVSCVRSSGSVRGRRWSSVDAIWEAASWRREMHNQFGSDHSVGGLNPSTGWLGDRWGGHSQRIHAPFKTHSCTHIYMSLCQSNLALRQRKHTGKREAEAQSPRDGGPQTTISFTCDKDSKSVTVSVCKKKKKTRWGMFLSNGWGKDSLEACIGP